MTTATTRILVPVDRSATALRALDPALQIARRLGVAVDVLTWSSSAEEAREAEREATEALQALGVDAPVVAAVTDDPGPAPAIAAAVRSAEATLVMSTHGRSGLGKALLGSVAEDVLRLVPGPVVLVGPQVDGWRGDGRLLVCLDGSPVAEAVMDPARTWSAQLGLPTVLVTVIEAGPRHPIPDEVLDGSYLTAAAERIAGLGEIGFEVLHGDAAGAIVDHATPSDLLAVATHGRSGFRRAALGSVAMKVVHRAPCPVLVVRGTGADAEEGPSA